MKYLSRTIAICSLVMLCVFFIAMRAHAQLTPEDAAKINADDISLTLDPEVPGANQNVTLTLNSYLTNLDRAVISWKVNDKDVLSNFGATKFTFMTGKIGEKSTVSVSMIVTSGEYITKSVVIDPSEVDLVWEGADAYVPPFYRGRALPSSESAIRVLAIPQIAGGSSVVDTSNYVFRWQKNDQVLSNDSGFGKSALVIAQDYLNPTTKIEVTGQNNTTGEIADGIVNVGTYNPKILLYSKDPVTGIDWNHELGDTIDVTTTERTVIAIPYFFSPYNILSRDLRYTWTINGDTIDTPPVENVLTLKSGDEKGASQLSLLIENVNKLFVDAKRDVTLNLK